MNTTPTPSAESAAPATPRTDAAEKELNSWTHSVSSDFARTLERELADCRRTCAELVTDGNAVTLAESLQRKCAELSAANERIAALEADKARLVELLNDVFSGSVDAGIYPDGPCLDRYLRKDIKAAIDAARSTGGEG